MPNPDQPMSGKQAKIATGVRSNIRQAGAYNIIGNKGADKFAVGDILAATVVQSDASATQTIPAKHDASP